MDIIQKIDNILEGSDWEKFKEYPSVIVEFPKQPHRIETKHFSYGYVVKKNDETLVAKMNAYDTYGQAYIAAKKWLKKNERKYKLKEIW